MIRNFRLLNCYIVSLLHPDSPRCLLHRLQNPLSFHAYSGYATKQIDHFLLVIGEAVGVEFLAYGRSSGFFSLYSASIDPAR